MELKEKREYRRKNRLCYTCGVKIEPESRFGRCKRCRAAEKRYKKKLTKKKMEVKQCRHCSNDAMELRVLCSNCATKLKERQSDRVAKIREQGVCRLCKDPEVLESAKRNNSQYYLCETCYLKKASYKSTGSRANWEALRERLDLQGWRCAYTGVPIVLGENDSIDHIKPISRFPELRYDVSNLEWVLLGINIMKRNMLEEEFLLVIEAVHSYTKLGLVSATLVDDSNDLIKGLCRIDSFPK